MAIYDVGDVVRVTGSFTNSAGTATDPTAVKVDLKKPDGTEVTYTYGTDAEVVKSSTGIYYADLSVTLAGIWYFRWYGTGAVTAAGADYFEVRKDLA